jgi:hypothetical protein
MTGDRRSPTRAHFHQMPRNPVLTERIEGNFALMYVEVQMVRMRTTRKPRKSKSADMFDSAGCCRLLTVDCRLSTATRACLCADCLEACDLEPTRPSRNAPVPSEHGHATIRGFQNARRRLTLTLTLRPPVCLEKRASSNVDRLDRLDRLGISQRTIFYQPGPENLVNT